MRKILCLKKLDNGVKFFEKYEKESRLEKRSGYGEKLLREKRLRGFNAE